MTKMILAVTGSLLLGTFFAGQAFSVVPSPLSLEEESDLSAENVAASTSPRSVSQVAEKLAEDERHLEKILQDLKENQKALKQAISKENPDGHPIH